MTGDVIKADRMSWTYEPRRFDVGRHLERLRHAGLNELASYALFELNLGHAADAQKYARLIAVK